MKMFETIFIICLECGVMIYLDLFWEKMSDMFGRAHEYKWNHWQEEYFRFNDRLKFYRATRKPITSMKVKIIKNFHTGYMYTSNEM